MRSSRSPSIANGSHSTPAVALGAVSAHQKRSHLTTLKLITEYQGARVPTVGVTLLFVNDRLSHFPDAWIQAGRFAGKDKSNLVNL